MWPSGGFGTLSEDCRTPRKAPDSPGESGWQSPWGGGTLMILVLSSTWVRIAMARDETMKPCTWRLLSNLVWPAVSPSLCFTTFGQREERNSKVAWKACGALWEGDKEGAEARPGMVGLKESRHNTCLSLSFFHSPKCSQPYINVHNLSSCVTKDQQQC